MTFIEKIREIARPWIMGIGNDWDEDICNECVIPVIAPKGNQSRLVLWKHLILSSILGNIRRYLNRLLLHTKI